MRMTVQASVTRQQSTNCTVLAKLDEQNRSITQVQETQQQLLLLLQQQNKEQQSRDRALAMEPSRQSTSDEGVGAGDSGGNVARRLREDEEQQQQRCLR
jgi:hypothetical protein